MSATFVATDEDSGLYPYIRGPGDYAEKVWFRMWYEPEHWDKDLNANGEFDRDAAGRPEAPVNPTSTSIDEWYPAIMQEFTYLLTRQGLEDGVHPPAYGPAGGTSLVFPVGMTLTNVITNTGGGFGLTSFDGNFDGVLDIYDIVHVESEATLAGSTGVDADFDGDGSLDPLDDDGDELSGDELVVFCLEDVPISEGNYFQFLDHVLRVESVGDTQVSIRVLHTGSMVPNEVWNSTLGIGEMLLAGHSTAGKVPADGNLGEVPYGPFFVWVRTLDPDEGKAYLWIGRALGAPFSGMEDGFGSPDDQPGDPWFLKRFYVDGHEYNVVAIGTRGHNEFGFITIRTPVPKVPVTIEQHSVELQDYAILEPLSVMPPFNREHHIIVDVQSGHSEEFEGEIVGPVPPILQDNEYLPYSLPYVGVGLYSPYTYTSEVYLTYVSEEDNSQFLGELKEKYGEDGDGEEFWYVEQWWTLPWQYTEFVLPDIRVAITEPYTDRYLLASAFYAPQARTILEVQDGDTTETTGTRVKFWFDPDDGGKKYKGKDEPSDISGLRLYSGNAGNYVGPGDTDVVTDTVVTFSGLTTQDVNVEVKPYTDAWAPFNPQFPQAPRKDSLTFNPAYLSHDDASTEPLADLYQEIIASNDDANEKVFFRMWYEPEYLDKVLEGVIEPRTTEESESEPNDSCGTADDIGLDTIMGGSLSAGGKDYYKFTLTPGAIVRIETGAGAMGDEWTDDTHLTLWADYPCPDDPLYEATDGGPGKLAVIEEHLPADEYYLRVKAGGGSAIEDYTVAIYVGDDRHIVDAWWRSALMQEFTYLFVRHDGQPTSGQPEFSKLAFPMSTMGATYDDQLPAPVPGTGDLPALGDNQFGFGLTSFDADFDGEYDIVTVHSENTLSETLSVGVDFDGDSLIDYLDQDGDDLTGDELVIFTVEGLDALEIDHSAQFLDHMATLENTSVVYEGEQTVRYATFNIWYTGGAHSDKNIPWPMGLTPDLAEGDMVLVYKDSIRKLSAGESNLGWPTYPADGQPWGPWFLYVAALDTTDPENATIIIGRALGATHSAIDDGTGTQRHDVTPGWSLPDPVPDGHHREGEPWFLKRFFVDGHEYNVVAIKTVENPSPQPGWEPYEFKYITIRTPVFKEYFYNTEDSLLLQQYHQVPETDFGQNTNIISVMPPFNYRHTRMNDIQVLTETLVSPVDGVVEPVFANPDFYVDGCRGDVVGNVSPLTITILAEETEPQFLGELKEKLWREGGPALTADAGFDKEKCECESEVIGGDPPVLGGTPPYTCSWSPTDWLTDSTKCNPIAHPPVGVITYTLTVTDSKKCTDSDSMVFTVNANPTASITPDPAEVCAEVDLPLHGNPSGGSGTYTTHSWTGDTGPLSATNVENPIFNATTPGLYNLTYCVTDSEGCVGCDSITVTVNANPTAYAGPDQIKCQADGVTTFTLSGSASGGTEPYTYEWSSDDPCVYIKNPNSKDTDVDISCIGSYPVTLTVTDAKECQDTDQVMLIVVTITATASSDPPVCEGETICLYGGPDGMDSYYWKGPDCWEGYEQNPCRENVKPSMSGTYALTITKTFFANTVTTMDSYSWTGPGGFRGTERKPTRSNATMAKGETYTPTVADVTLSTKLYLPLVAKNYPPCVVCTDTVTTIVTVNPNPMADAGPDEDICEGGSTQIGSNPTCSHDETLPCISCTCSWSPTEGLDDPTKCNPTASPDNTTTYCVTCTDSKGCTGTDCMTVTVNPNPTATACSSKPRVCEGGTIQLWGNASGGTPGYSYHWVGPNGWESDDQNPRRENADPSMAGTYTLTVTDKKLCTDTATIEVDVVPCICEQILCNWNFENRWSWIVPNTPRPAYYSTAVVHSGSWAMHLGITSQSDVYSFSSIYQQLTIPGDAETVTLSFWYYPICHDTFPSDWQTAVIYDPNWQFLAYAMPKICSNDQTWKQHTFDLTPYKGRTIILYFTVYNNGVGNRKTAMYVDDASVQVCYLP